VDPCRGNHSDFPLSFSFEGSMSLFIDSLRSCSTSLWRQHVQSRRPCWAWYGHGGQNHFLWRPSVTFRSSFCNVPIFGFPYYAVRFTSGGLSPPGQRGETMTSERSEGLEEFCGAQLSSFTFIHHQDHFRTTCLWFRCIPTISVILSYYGAYFN
jgi:hypothetical protein